MMKKIRVLQLIASSRGGGASHVRDLALGLDPARFAVEVAMPADGGNVSQADFEPAAIPFHVVDITAGLSAAGLQQVRRLSGQVDVLHLHGARAALFGRTAWMHTLLRPGMRPYRKAKRPRLVYTIHGFAAPHYPQPRRAVLLSIERSLAPVTDRFIAVCQAERAAFLAQGISRPERVSVIANGIRVADFQGHSGNRAATRQALGVPADALLVTMVCRLDKPRDFDTLLRAFAQVAHTIPAAHLLIVGDGPLRPSVEQQIGALRLGERVTLAGWQQNLPAIYAASDLYTLTTWGWEGLPLTIVEAMAAGLPVVATQAGGIPEVVIAGETGLLVGRQDMSGLADGLKRLLGDAAERERMGTAGQKRAAQYFTVERMVAETAAVYEELLDKVTW
jgi:glycosyltransferase involved in cell wall biosynthesis